MPDQPEDDGKIVDLDPTESEFASFDKTVGPQSSGPPVSSNAPRDQEEPHGAVDGTEAELDDPLPEFDPRWRDEFEGLMFIGRLSHQFTYLGHSFIIRTMTMEEVLEISLLIQQWEGTVGGPRAYSAACVAACVEQIDGKPLPMPITNARDDTLLRNRFTWVLRNLFPPVIDAIYQEILMLEAKVDRVLEAMGEA